MHTIRCPACRGDVGVDPSDVGHAVACPLCGDVFTPQGDFRSFPDEPERPLDEPAPDHPSSRRFEDDEEEDFDRPSRSRRRRRPDSEVAAEAVRRPANGLIWTGYVGAVLGVCAGLAYVGLGLFMINDPKGPGNDGWMIVTIGAATAALSIPYFLVISAGGRQLKRLDGGTGLVYAAAVMGIATVALCGVCWPSTWAAVTFGIWALVAVNKTEVRAVLEAARGES